MKVGVVLLCWVFYTATGNVVPCSRPGIPDSRSIALDFLQDSQTGNPVCCGKAILRRFGRREGFRVAEVFPSRARAFVTILAMEC